MRNPPRNSEILVVDVETTGSNPFRHDLLAVAFVPLEANVRPYQVYVKPADLIWSDYGWNNFQRFSNEWHAQGVSPHIAYEQIESYVRGYSGEGKTIPAGHNVGFDLSFLRKLAFHVGKDEVTGISHRAVDTHTLLYVLFLAGKVPKQALSSDGAFDFFGIHIEPSHRHTALGDALATRDLLLILLDMLKIGSVDAYETTVGEDHLLHTW